jgi:hypothetical protein
MAWSALLELHAAISCLERFLTKICQYALDVMGFMYDQVEKLRNQFRVQLQTFIHPRSSFQRDEPMEKQCCHT